MDYIGEHLLPGQIGQILLVLSLVASLVACFAYAKSTNAKLETDALSWKKFARAAFLVDVVSVLSIFAIIYLIIAKHYFEYYYAWNHSDKSLAPKYLLSSIWEGQEGSFLLWAFWHGMLGLVLIKTSKKWEAPVMTVISFAQFCLASMLIGLYVFDLKIGSNPFLLTRHIFSEQPFFESANYLSHPKMQDGNGLNQLLQNYWMVIHPPVLFLGFASTIVPFAYAMAGLWKKDYGGWIKQALPFSLFSAAILGLGIMMGGKWAYESLNFGGYWAWDPVENASLVPWLILVAGLHTQVIYNSTGHSLRATYFFYIVSFLLILYSTYLTRSGDLQDTSVHAFVTSGMNWQLRALVFVFLVPSVYLFIRNYKHIPHIKKEEGTWSREFWMFIGSLVLFLSSLAIIIPTSFPLINKIFGTNLVIGEEREFAYNRIQIFIAIIIGLLTAIGQYLKYKSSDKATFIKKMLVPTAIALLIALGFSIWGNINYDKFGMGFLISIHIALFAAIYAAVANIAYIWLGLNGKLKAAGASVAHFGFGLMLVGILLSSAKKETLSMNRFNPLNFGPEASEKGEENLTMFLGERVDMGKYWATYVKDSSAQNGKMIYFHIEMETKDGKEKFNLYPDLIKNTKGQQNFSNNPDAKHYWNRDIFSYISYADKLADDTDTTQFRNTIVNIGDTVYYSAGYMVLDSVRFNPPNNRVSFSANDTAMMAKLRVTTAAQKKYTVEPFLYIRGRNVVHMPDTIASQGLAVSINRIVDKKFEIGVKESAKLSRFVALKVLKFPFINLVWIGTIFMVIGFGMSIARRVRLLR
jgi:cytochrome c-type biogenesis protein CcmF